MQKSLLPCQHGMLIDGRDHHSIIIHFVSVFSKKHRTQGSVTIVNLTFATIHHYCTVYADILWYSSIYIQCRYICLCLYFTAPAIDCAKLFWDMGSRNTVKILKGEYDVIRNSYHYLNQHNKFHNFMYLTFRATGKIE